MTPDSTKCPTRIVSQLTDYVEFGTPPGGFLRYVLENNMTAAIGHADENNCEALPHIVAYCWKHLPNGSWGSPEKVEAHLERVYEQRMAGMKDKE